MKKYLALTTLISLSIGSAYGYNGGLTGRERIRTTGMKMGAASIRSAKEVSKDIRTTERQLKKQESELIKRGSTRKAQQRNSKIKRKLSSLNQELSAIKARVSRTFRK